MSDTFYFGKELKVYLENSSGLFWRIPVVSEPTFNQAAESTETTVTSLPQYNSTQVSSTSSKKVFRTDFSPAEWSFSTQINTFANFGGAAKQSSEGILWEFFTGQSITEAGTLDNNVSLKETFDTFNLYFVYPNNRGYKINNCVISSAQIDISLGTLTTIAWAGSGIKLEQITFTTPSQIQNSSALAGTNRVINNLTTITFSGAGDSSQSTGELLWGGIQAGSTRFLAGHMGTATGSVSSSQTGDAGVGNDAGTGLYQLCHTDRTRFGVKDSTIKTVPGGAGTVALHTWAITGFLNLDTNNDLLGWDIFPNYITNTLKIGDQVKIENSSTNYGVYRIKNKHILPTTDSAEGVSAGGALSPAPDTNDLGGASYTRSAAVSLSHYPWQTPDTFSGRALNDIDTTNFENTFTQKAVLASSNSSFPAVQTTGQTPGESRFLATSAHINEGKVAHVLTKDTIEGNTLFVNGTGASQDNKALFWTGIDYTTQVFNDINEFAVKVESSTANTLVLDAPVTITAGTTVYTHSGATAPAPLVPTGTGGSTVPTLNDYNDEHGWAKFDSGIWYTPTGFGYSILGLNAQAMQTSTFEADVAGRADNGTGGTGYKQASAGYSTGTLDAVGTITTVASSGSHGSRRFRATRGVVVGNLTDPSVGTTTKLGLLAANSLFSSEMLMGMALRSHPITMYFWAPYKQPTYIKVYEYQTGQTSGSHHAKFVKKEGGGYYKSNGTDEITAQNVTLDGSASLPNMWKNQREATFTSTATPSNASEIIGYLIESDAPICGIQRSSANNIDCTILNIPTKNEGTAYEHIIDDGNISQFISVDLDESSNSNPRSHDVTIPVVTAGSATGLGGSTIMGTTRRKTSKINARACAWRFADGSGSDVRIALTGKRVGDHYTYPDADLHGFKIIPYMPADTSGKIYVRTLAQKIKKEELRALNDSTELTSTDGLTTGNATNILEISTTRNSTTLTDTKVSRGPHDGGVPGGSANFQLTQTGNYAAGASIPVKDVSYSLISGARFQLQNTGAFYRIMHHNAGTDIIVLDSDISIVANDINVDTTLNRTEISALTGPFYFEGTHPFIVIVNNTNGKETTLLGTRYVGQSASDRGSFNESMGFTVPGTTDLYIKPNILRTTDATALVSPTSASSPQLKAGASYAARTLYHFDIVGQKYYARGSFLARTDGDTSLELEHLHSVGSGLTTDDVEVRFSRSLDGSRNTPFIGVGNVPITQASLGIQVEHSAIKGDLLGSVNYPVAFSRGSISAKGSFNAYLCGDYQSAQAAEFATNLMTSQNPIHQVTLNIGGIETGKSIRAVLPKAFLSNPSFSPEGVLQFSSEFEALDSGDTTSLNDNPAIKITYV